VHESLLKLTKADLAALYAAQIVTSGKERKILLVSTSSHRHVEADEVVAGNGLEGDTFKEKSRLQVVKPAFVSIGE
jgi:hypothetical protein